MKSFCACLPFRSASAIAVAVALVVSGASTVVAQAVDDELWLSIVAAPLSESPNTITATSREMADLHPTLQGIDIRGSQEFDVPWHAIPLSKLTPITPIIEQDTKQDSINPPILEGPRLAMRPGSTLPKEPGFAPVWRAPSASGDDISDAFSQADKIADTERSATTVEPRPNRPTVDPTPRRTTSGLKPLEEEPVLDKVPSTTAKSAPASPPADKPSPSTQSPAPRNSVADEEPRDKTPSPPVVQPKPLKPLTRNEINLRNKMRTVLTHYYRRPLQSSEHDSWEIMHGMLAYGLDSTVRQGDMRGDPITAIGWLCYNNESKRTKLLEVNADGELRALYGVGVQGHLGQFLAMLAQCNVTRSYPIHVDQRKFTIEDLIVSEQKTCYTDNELTFKLIGLMHYLPSDAKWLNDRGEQWSIDRLIAEELKQPIRGAACGGTHRLAGLSLAANRRIERKESLDGEFARAAAYTAQYEELCFRLQNSDGSLSTEWFRGPGDEKDLDRRIRTTGHQLEWMIYQINDEKLDYWRTVRAVNYLTNILYSNADHEWDTGALCHALHALVLYDQRKFQPYDGDVPSLASRVAIPAASKSPTKSSYGPTRDDDRNSGFRLFGGRR